MAEAAAAGAAALWERGRKHTLSSQGLLQAGCQADHVASPRRSPTLQEGKLRPGGMTRGRMAQMEQPGFEPRHSWLQMCPQVLGCKSFLEAQPRS